MCENPEECQLVKLMTDLNLALIPQLDFESYRFSQEKRFEKLNHLALFRDNKNSPFGKLFYRGVFLCDVLENLDKRIPEGLYGLELTFSPKFKTNLYEVTNVVGRSRILLHSGNYVSDSSGCLLLGVRNDTYLRYSTMTLERVMDIIKTNFIHQILVRYA